jgi:uncharacterized repeat protein (TIGR01451 family)
MRWEPQSTTVGVGQKVTTTTTKSNIINTGSTTFSAYSLATVEYYNSLTFNWDYLATIVNDTSTSTIRTKIPLDLFNLRQLFAGGGNWNTSMEPFGWYRVIFSLTDPAGNILRDDTGNYLNISVNFTISPDVTAPNITSLTVSPSIIGYGGAVTIEILVDDESGISTALAEITYPDSTKQNHTMSFVSQSLTVARYRLSFNDTYQRGVYTFTIFANDTEGNIVYNEDNGTFNAYANTSNTIFTIKDSYFIGENVTLTHADSWWNTSYTYRIPIVVDTGYTKRSHNTVVKQLINFTTAMTQLGISGSINTNSIRVTTQSGTLVADDVPRWSTDNKTAMLRFKLGTGGASTMLSKNTVYTYYVYFNLIGSGSYTATSYTLPREYMICTGTNGAGFYDYHYAFSQGNGSFTSFTDIGTSTGSRRAHVFDMENDGDYDFMLSAENVEYRYYRNTNDASGWNFANVLNFGSPDYWGGMCQLDADQDGWMDIIVEHAGGTVYLYHNQNGATFQQVELYDQSLPIDVAPSQQSRQVACGDFNGDGNADFIAGAQGTKPEIYLGDGTATPISFSFYDYLNPTTTHDWHGAWVYDYEFDGDLDLFVQGAAGSLYLYKNIGDAIFTEINLNNNAQLDFEQWGDGSLWDWNNDGLLDMSRGDWDASSTPRIHFGNLAQTYDFNAPTVYSDLVDDYHMDCSGPEYLQDLITTQGAADYYDVVSGTVNTNTSETTNIGTTALYPLVTIIVQRYNGTAWNYYTTVVNETQTLLVGGFFSPRVLWNLAGGFSTANVSTGDYRVNISLLSPEYDFLRNQVGSSMTTYYNFSIIIDTEAPKYYSLNVPSTTQYRGQTVAFNARWTDNYALYRAILSSNQTGSYTNATLAANKTLNGTSSWSNFSFSIPSTTIPGKLGLRIYGKDTFSNYNLTPVQTINIWSYVTLNASVLAPNDTYTEQDITIRCQVIDFNYSTPIAGKNVSFAGDLGQLGSALSNATGWASLTFQDMNAIPPYENITCTIANQTYYTVKGTTQLVELLHAIESFVSLTLWDDADISPVYQEEAIYIYANYTNQFDVAPLNGTCNITLQGSTYAMSKLIGTQNITWQHLTNFTLPGLYEFNVSCNNPLQPTITDTEYVLINDSAAPIITLVAPADNQTFLDFGNITFTYNVTDYNNISNCMLVFDNISIMNVTNPLKNQNNTFVYAVNQRGWHDWYVTCYDTTPLSNQGFSENRSIFIAYPDFNLSWVTIPSKLYRLDSAKEFTITITNNGTSNVTDLGVNMTLPEGWNFSAGNTSYQAIGLLLVGQSVNVTWFIDVNLTAPLGLQNVTVNASSIIRGLTVINITVVAVGSKDVMVYNITSPTNASCGFSESVVINATIYNPGENTTWFTVLFKINGNLVNWTNTSVDMDTGDYLNVSYTHKFGNESIYSITVQTNLSTDTIPSNDILTYVYNKYNEDVSLIYDVASVTPDNYSVSLTMINNKNCTLTAGGDMYYFLPSAFNPLYSSVPNQTMFVSSYSGNSSVWRRTMPALSNYTIQMNLTGASNYLVAGLYTIGSG